MSVFLWLEPRSGSTVLTTRSTALHHRAGGIDLYADHLVIVTDSLEACVRRLLIQKVAIEEKGLRVNVHDVRYRPGPPAEFR